MYVQRYAQAFGIGMVAGLRSMTAPAIANAAKRNAAAGMLATLAIGEMIVDKLPFVPARTQWPALVVRAITGAAAAWVMPHDDEREKQAAAVLGGVGAVAGAYLGEALRRRAVQALHIPDPVVALFEDGIAVGACALLR
jgi:uncharacterized membrane protein